MNQTVRTAGGPVHEGVRRGYGVDRRIADYTHAKSRA